VLIPGLLLQGVGLGIVLTVNDPTGLTAVPEPDQGQGAGMINTAEQLGGALGIAALTAVLLDDYWHRIDEVLGARGIHPTQAQIEQGREFILDVEEKGRDQVVAQRDIKYVLGDVVNAHASAYELTLFVAGGIALLGALACFVLVRRGDRVSEGGPIFSRPLTLGLRRRGPQPGYHQAPSADALAVLPCVSALGPAGNSALLSDAERSGRVRVARGARSGRECGTNTPGARLAAFLP
jgi:hypothetical protein